jgi:hypothetical protein
VRRDVIYSWMNLPHSVQQITAPQQLVAHLDFILWRLLSYLQYIGIVKNDKAAETLLQCQDINIAWWWSWIGNHAFSQSYHDKLSLSAANTTPPKHNPACSAYQIGLHNHWITQQKHTTLNKIHLHHVQNIKIHHVHIRSCAGVCTISSVAHWYVTHSHSTSGRCMRGGGGSASLANVPPSLGMWRPCNVLLINIISFITVYLSEQVIGAIIIKYPV